MDPRAHSDTQSTLHHLAPPFLASTSHATARWYSPCSSVSLTTRAASHVYVCLSLSRAWRVQVGAAAAATRGTRQRHGPATRMRRIAIQLGGTFRWSVRSVYQFLPYGEGTCRVPCCSGTGSPSRLTGPVPQRAVYHITPVYCIPVGRPAVLVASRSHASYHSRARGRSGLSKFFVTNMAMSG